MARQEIDLTTPQPNGRMGEPTKSAWEKVNDMTAELYPLAEGASEDAADALAAANASQATANSAQATANAALPATATTALLSTNQLRIITGPFGSAQYNGHFPVYISANPNYAGDVLQYHYYRDNASGNDWSDFNWRIGRYVNGGATSLIQFSKNYTVSIVSNTSRFDFNPNGNATAPGSFVNGGSDPAIKDADSLREISGATAALLGLNVRIGKYLEKHNPDGLERAFVMADDAMRKSTPEVIIENVIDGKYAGWATDQLIAYLVAHVQESQSVIDDLKYRISQLESK